jgi:hypothetical protein
MAQYCCFMGVGVISMAPWAQFLAKKVGLTQVGNVTKADLNIQERTIGGIKNRQSYGGGDECSKKVIDSISLSLAMTCFKDINIVNALYGDLTSQAAASTVSEPRVAYKGSNISLYKYPATPSNIVVKGAGATSATTYVLGVDYLVNEFGNAITIPLSSTIPTPTVSALGAVQDNITIIYSSKAASLIGIASKITVPMFIQIDGGNLLYEDEADGSYSTTFFKANLSPAQVISFITDSDTANKMEMEGILTADKNFQAIYGSESSFGVWLKAA